MEKWNNQSYREIKEAKLTKNNDIYVKFENNDEFELPRNIFISHEYKDIDWKNLSFNSFEIIIPAEPNPIEIPWDKIRVIKDKLFGKYLAQKAEEQDKLIGIKIKRLREKKGIKSNELAERAGLTPQTISRIEQGHTDVNFATLRKILASIGYTLKDLANEEIEIEMEQTEKSYSFLMKKFRRTGIDHNILVNKIIPTKLQNDIKKYTERNDDPEIFLDEAATYVGKIYNWELNEIWSNKKLEINQEAFDLALYKNLSNINENQIKAYSNYAYYLAKLVLKAYPEKELLKYPSDIEEFKKLYFKKYKKIQFDYLLEFAWGMGICILPLNDTGVFHGASWNIDGRHIIILKQRTKSHARWIFDLLHELYHVFCHLNEDNSSILELEELNPFQKNDSEIEVEANTFANLVIFDKSTRAEELAQKCVEIAKGKMENLKNAVIEVSKKEKITQDFIANYIAFKLDYQGQNWWGTASKLQITEPEPFNIACNFLKNKINIQKLNQMDINLLNNAINN